MEPLLVLRLLPFQALERWQGSEPEWLTPGERQRLLQFSGSRRREQFLGGRWLLRCMLGEHLGAEPQDLAVDIDEGGRTRINAAPALFANLSHTGGWVAGVLASEPAGIDIENLHRQRDFLSLSRAVCGPVQRAMLEGLAEDQRARWFYTWWTLKEAWLKRQGLGLDMARMRELHHVRSDHGGSCAALVLEEAGIVLALDSAVCELTALPELRMPRWANAATERWQRYALQDRAGAEIDAEVASP